MLPITLPSDSKIFWEQIADYYDLDKSTGPCDMTTLKIHIKYVLFTLLPLCQMFVPEAFVSWL